MSVNIPQELFEVLKENAVVNLIDREGSRESITFLEKVFRAQFSAEEKAERKAERAKARIEQNHKRVDRAALREGLQLIPTLSRPIFRGLGDSSRSYVAGSLSKKKGWSLRKSEYYIDSLVGMSITSEMGEFLYEMGCDIHSAY